MRALIEGNTRYKGAQRCTLVQSEQLLNTRKEGDIYIGTYFQMILESFQNNCQQLHTCTTFLKYTKGRAPKKLHHWRISTNCQQDRAIGKM